MKKVSTTIQTGQHITYNGSPAIVGTYLKGVITIKVSISKTSCISLFYSTKQINKLIADNNIIL